MLSCVKDGRTVCKSYLVRAYCRDENELIARWNVEDESTSSDRV